MLLFHPDNPSISSGPGAPSTLPASSTEARQKRKDAIAPEIPLEADLDGSLCTEKSLTDFIDPAFLADDPKKDDVHDAVEKKASDLQSPEQLTESTPPSTPDDAPGPFDAILRPPEEIIDLRRESPFRPVDFRWQLGIYLAADGPFPRTLRGKATLEARDFIRYLKSCKSDACQFALEKMEPEKWGALMLYLADPPQRRWEAEARLLTGESTETIAKKVSMSPGVIQCYESWFFAVTDRLAARDYITHQVIREHDEHDKEKELSKLWKHYGYVGGPLVLDALIYGSSQGERPKQPSELAAFFAAELSSTLYLKALTSAYLIPVIQSTYTKIFNLFYRLRKLEAKSRVSPAPPVDYSRNIQAWLDGLPWTKKRGNEKIDELVGKLPPGSN